VLPPVRMLIVPKAMEEEVPGKAPTVSRSFSLLLHARSEATRQMVSDSLGNLTDSLLLNSSLVHGATVKWS